jgi:hypothetical protein
MHTSLHVFHNWGENLSHKMMKYSYSKEMFTPLAKAIRILGDPEKRSSTVMQLLQNMKEA